MLELTATYGDGWYPTMLTSPQEYAAKLDTIHSTARKGGRDPQAITPALHRFVVVAPTERKARALLQHKAIRSFALAAPAELWTRAGARHPLGERFRGYIDLLPERYNRAQLEEALAAVPPELVEDGPLLWGTPEQVAGKLQAFGDAGLRHVVLAPVSGLVSRSAAIYSLRAIRTIARALASRR
jgi:phthiodiolone/phenolphthiodiolone dimycocerosates ketoreductase